MRFGTQNPGAVVSAIPRTLRTMFLHAAQSWVWNHAATYRMQEYGDEVVEGDLVCLKIGSDSLYSSDSDPGSSSSGAPTRPIRGLGSVRDLVATSLEESGWTVRHVTVADIEDGTLSISDVG